MRRHHCTRSRPSRRARSHVWLALPVFLAAAEPACGKEKAERGIASWYGSELHGHLTASGVPMDRQRLTAAHRDLPLGSVVEVLNRRNGRRVVVTITDRGPASPNRVIDVSPVAAAQLGMKKRGLAPVEIRAPLFE
jgi:rare lipoprotein A (peptidoglycan hydrolase)